jgi:hypothetical protein
MSVLGSNSVHDWVDAVEELSESKRKDIKLLRDLKKNMPSADRDTIDDIIARLQA